LNSTMLPCVTSGCVTTTFDCIKSLLRETHIGRMVYQLIKQVLVGLLIGGSLAEPYNTFDGDGFPACNNVAQVYQPSSVDEMVNIVKQAASSGTPVRASGKGHM